MNSKEIQVGVIVIDEALGTKSYKSYKMMHIWINLIGTFSLGVIHKRRPQGGGRGGQRKRDTCGHRGEGGQARVDVHKKILKKVSKKHELMAKVPNHTYNIQKWAN